MRWDEETQGHVYYDGEYNGVAPAIGAAFWGYTYYSTYGPPYQKPTHPLQTDLFYGYDPIENLTAEQVAGYRKYYLQFNLYSNWSGFLKRDYQYIADRTDDWLG